MHSESVRKFYFYGSSKSGSNTWKIGGVFQYKWLPSNKKIELDNFVIDFYNPMRYL